jgi:hypothetical protein
MFINGYQSQVRFGNDNETKADEISKLTKEQLVENGLALQSKSGKTVPNRELPPEVQQEVKEVLTKSIKLDIQG